MCGILAVHCNKEEKSIQGIVDGYNHLSNRGPDKGQMIIREHILGFRRLTIVDKTANGMQPFCEDGVSVLCNGEIYNHEALKKEHTLPCKSNCDCECILHLYKAKGIEFTVNALSGDFAFIIMDGNKMYLARDRVGVRPLFWGVTKSGNPAAASYARALTGYCTRVEAMEPGWMSYSSVTEEMDFHAYAPIWETGSVISREVAIPLIRETLVKSVKDRLMSDRPIGCLLSGGLDSSLVTAMLCSLIGAENVRTYSVGIQGSRDLFYAKQVAEFLGTVHHEVFFTPEEGFDSIPCVIRDLESYDITTVRASVGMWLLSRWISENTDDIVILSGEGADELFCGYLYFHYAPCLDALQNESRRLLGDLHMYDVLRADRCVCSHGLELRVPFLDREMIKLCLSMVPELKAPIDGIEKHILRSSFDADFLPEDVLWRRKDGMSDGISGDSGKKWYQEIQEFVEPLITDEDAEMSSLPSKEALYYKRVYDELFPCYDPRLEYWMPKWVESNGDPSGRILPVFGVAV